MVASEITPVRRFRGSAVMGKGRGSSSLEKCGISAANMYELSLHQGFRQYAVSLLLPAVHQLNYD